MKYRECAVSNIRCNEAVNGPLLSVKLMQSFQTPVMESTAHQQSQHRQQTQNHKRSQHKENQHLHTVLHRHLSFWTFSEKTNTVEYIHQGSKLAQWHIMKNK